MSEICSKKEFDQLSSFSFKSQISIYQFKSPLPLPKNPERIPSNEEIGDGYQSLEKQLQEVQVEKLVSLLYKNVIEPKVKEEAISQAPSHRSGRSDCSSRYSTISQAATIKPGNLNFKVHPIRNQFETPEMKQEEQKKKKKRKRQGRGLRNRSQGERDALYSMIQEQKGQNEQNLRKAKAWSAQQNKEYQLFSKNNTKNFQSKQDEINFQEKKLVARGFCEKGYGLDKLKEMVWEDQKQVLKLDKRRYKNICNTIVGETYRKLEQFLIQDCNRNIKPLTGPEVRALQPVLMNSQAKFEDDQYLTLRKFMKVCFDLGSVSIFEQSTVKLYIKIQACLRGRIGAMKLDKPLTSEFKQRRDMIKSPGRFQNQRLENESIWTAQLEMELLDIVIQHKTIAKTRDTLKLKYGENVVLNDVKQLKARFFKILRLSAKRLIRYAAQFAHEVPLLVNVGDQKVKTIIRHPDALDARMALAKLYKCKKVQPQLLTEVINVVNEFCYMEQTKREATKEQPKQPIINTVTDKIKHNINVSRRMLKNVTTPAQRAKAQDSAQDNLIFLKESMPNYQHIVSLQHNDKLHYFRKTGAVNNKGGFEYVGKPAELRRLELQDGDDDSEQEVILSDDDYESDEDES